MEIFNLILSIIGFLGVISFGPCIIAGIILLVMSSNNADAIKKASFKKWGIILIIAPFVLVIGSLVFLVILTAVKALLAG